MESDHKTTGLYTKFEVWIGYWWGFGIGAVSGLMAGWGFR